MKKIIILIALVAPSFGFASVKTVNFITDSQMRSIEAKFNQAKAPSKIDGTKWSCTMYGARSLTFNSTPKKLYNFKVNGKQVANNGSHFTKAYTKTSEGLVAVKSTVTDTVRIAPDNTLISRLTLRGQPVSFSICSSGKG